MDANLILEMYNDQIMPYLAKILIYPIKSLDGVEVTTAQILASGALQGDREFAIVKDRSASIATPSGQIVNGKRYPQIHRIRADYDLSNRIVQLGVEGNPQRSAFHLDCDRKALSEWLSDYFQFPVQLLQNTATGYPDDLDSPGPTLVSTATLEAVTSWFTQAATPEKPSMTLEELRRRLRTNLEISGVPAFWEDQLFGDSNEQIPFQIGNVTWLGINPCQRCIVPTRNTRTGEPDPHFKAQFIHNRQHSLPNWVNSSRFNHFYRLCINTCLQEKTSVSSLQINDPITLQPKQ